VYEPAVNKPVNFIKFLRVAYIIVYDRHRDEVEQTAMICYTRLKNIIGISTFTHSCFRYHTV